MQQVRPGNLHRLQRCLGVVVLESECQDMSFGAEHLLSIHSIILVDKLSMMLLHYCSSLDFLKHFLINNTISNGVE